MKDIYGIDIIIITYTHNYKRVRAFIWCGAFYIINSRFLQYHTQHTCID